LRKRPNALAGVEVRRLKLLHFLDAIFKGWHFATSLLYFQLVKHLVGAKQLSVLFGRILDRFVSAGSFCLQLAMLTATHVGQSQIRSLVIQDDVVDIPINSSLRVLIVRRIRTWAHLNAYVRF
jgi:hypothetical protein